MTVLIVDDEAYMVTYIEKLVDWESYGFDKVLTTGSGSMARDLLRDYQPQLLITDIRMPKTSGLDLSQFIDENKLPTKVVIISGYSDFEYAKQAMRYGVSEYLVKPIVKKDFVETLERVLQKHFGWKEKAQEISTQSRDKAMIVAYVKSYINENYDKDLSLEMLGEVAHLHPVYLSKIFKEITDVNLSWYITDVRMQEAARLLSETDSKVYEVMEKLGYKKSQYFSKLFKEKYGMTPKEYRNRYGFQRI